MSSITLCVVLALAANPQEPAAQDPKDSAGIRPQEGKRKPVPKEESSSGNLISRDRSTVSLSVLSGADLRDLGVETYTDALRLMPGLEIQKLSASESAVSERGYVGPASASQGMMALVDGRQAYNEFFGAPFWDTLPISLNEVKSIEVIRGPGSFLYGPNALHGLVNIKTLSPLDYGEGTYSNHQAFMSMAAGTYASSSETFTMVRREGASALKASVAHDDIDQFDDRGDTKNKLFGEIRFQTKLEGGHELDVTGGASRQKFDVLFPTTSFLIPATYETRANEMFLKARYVFQENLKIQMSWTRFDADGRPDLLFVPFSLLLDTGDLDVQYAFAPASSHRVTIGTGIRYSTFTTHDADVSGGRHATQVEWVFVQDEIDLATNVFLTGGARFDFHSTAKGSLAPRLALVYRLVAPVMEGDVEVEPGQSLRATVGYGYRNPSLRDLWFDMTTPVGSVVGNRALDPEMVRSFEIGYWGRLAPGIQADCNVYYNLADHLVVFVPGAGGLARQNLNKEDSYGIEANCELQVTEELFLFGNYAYELRHNRETHNRIPDGPLNKANAGIRYRTATGFSGMLWLNFFDETTSTDKFTGAHVGHVPAYALVNAKIWHPIRLGSADGRVFIQGFNAFNHNHREHPDGDAYGAIAMAGLEIAW